MWVIAGTKLQSLMWRSVALSWGSFSESVPPLGAFTPFSRRKGWGKIVVLPEINEIPAVPFERPFKPHFVK